MIDKKVKDVEQHPPETPLGRPNPRTGTSNSKYDYETLTGKRSTSSPIWRYRHPSDIAPLRTQSIDLGDDTLPRAAAEGRIFDVHRLLKEGHNIESTGSRAVPDGTTALYRAARADCFEVVHVLLRHGADPNPRRKDGKSLVRVLADRGSVELLRLLLEYGATFQNQGVLPQAALFGRLEVVQLLLNYGAEIDEVEKQTALYRAASKGFTQIVELLLREGASTGFVTPGGQSALYKAVQNEHFECVNSLLLYGARPSLGVGKDGETALYQACSLGHEPTVRLLLRRGAKPNENFPRTARLKSSVTTSEIGPLHLAARESRLGVAMLLLEYGADVRARALDGKTAVDIAAEKGHIKMVDMLLTAGAQPPQQSYNAMNLPRRASDSLTKSDLRRPRRYSASTPELPYRDVKPANTQSSRPPMDIEAKRRSKSSFDSRAAASSAKQQGSSSASKFGAAAAAMFLADAFL